VIFGAPIAVGVLGYLLRERALPTASAGTTTASAGPGTPALSTSTTTAFAASGKATLTAPEGP
jgi:hypothetical protein